MFVKKKTIESAPEDDLEATEICRFRRANSK
jgi:hypothetical protein